MAINSIESLFQSIELNDAKSIVKHSSDVHDSITYLDLSVVEFSSFRSGIAISNSDSPRTFTAYSKSKEFSIENLTHYSRQVIPSLHLDLPRYRALDKTRVGHSYPFPLERDDGFYVAQIYVSKSWYLRTLQGFMILFIKSAKQKLNSFKKFHSYNFVRYLNCENGGTFKLFYCMSILCIECSDSDRVKGVLIAFNFPGFDSEEIREYFLYHNCISTGNSFPQTTDLGEDIIRELMQVGLFRFIPHLLKCGFSTLYEERDREAYDGKIRISRRRIKLMFDLLSLQVFHRLEYEYIESFGRFKPKYAHTALVMLWRCIPDAFLSQKEFALEFSRLLPELSIEQVQSTYEGIVGPYPSEPTPRSLTHYCRITIRKVIASNHQLPHGISKLDLPATLLSFLRLEY